MTVSINKKTINNYLNDVKGIIHVGANSGQECKWYNRNNLNVIWIEPIPSLFTQLLKNIRPYPKQRAFEYLITDKDVETYNFHIANNNGASSSILELGQTFNDNHPTIHYLETISLQSITLTTMLIQEGIDIEEYDALVIDTQGSELLVLEGAKDLLQHFKYIRAEATDFELYKGCCFVPELETFLRKYGFEELYRHTSESGHEFDIVYRRIK